MNDRKTIRTGLIGSAVAAVCCFTPVLVIGLGAVGLSAWLGWLDYVLFPMLGFFLALTAYGFYLRRRCARCQPAEGEDAAAGHEPAQ